MYKVIAIRNMFNEEIDISNIEFTFVGEDYAIGHYKGSGFLKNYSKANCYTVITEKVS